MDVDKMLKAVMLKDLRVICRARGLSPAGGKEQLIDRLKEHMHATGNYSINGDAPPAIAGVSTGDMEVGHARNNYSRPEGQNVGNFLTDRASSRVLAPPGGGSSIVFGDDAAPAAAHAGAGRQGPGSLLAQPAAAPSPAHPAMKAPAAVTAASGSTFADGHTNNNYSRPEGQNVGNFLTDRSSSRVLAPPGGFSSITFG